MTSNLSKSMLAASATAALLLSACVQPGRTSHPHSNLDAPECPVEVAPGVTTDVVIAWQPIPNGDLLVKDRGYLESCMPNANIRWVKMNSGGDVIQAFGAGSIDISQVGSSPTIKAASPPLNVSVKVVWLSDIIGAAESLAVRDSAVTDISQLEGATIATPFGSTAHFSLLMALGEAGLTEKVNLMNLTPDAIMGAWGRDEIDAAWIWEPTLSVLLQEGKLLMTGEETAAMGAPTFDLIAATTQFVDANPEFMRTYTAVQAYATEDLKNDPEAAFASIAAQAGIPQEQARTLMEGYIYPSASEQASQDFLSGEIVEVFSNTADFLATEGEVDAAPPASVLAEIPYTDALEALEQP